MRHVTSRRQARGAWCTRARWIRALEAPSISVARERLSCTRKASQAASQARIIVRHAAGAIVRNARSRGRARIAHA